MKFYLAFLLIGLIYSENCILYNRGREKQTKRFGKCPCPTGLVGLVDPDMKDCYCYHQSQIDECRAAGCRFDNYVGCYV